MEESGETRGRDPQHRWIVDPLDGTTNFLHGIPLFAISIALERQGTLAAGLVYNPIADELFTAERGGGAFLNDRRLRVAARRKLADAVIATGMPHLGRGDHGALPEGARRGDAAGRGRPALRRGRARPRLGGGRPLRRLWERDLSAWDMAAGILLVREAGGFVTDLDGGEAHARQGAHRRRQRGDPSPASRAAEAHDPALRFHMTARNALHSG